MKKDNRRVKGCRTNVKQKTGQMCESEKKDQRKLKWSGQTTVKGKLCNEFESGKRNGTNGQSERNGENVTIVTLNGNWTYTKGVK